MNPPSQHHMPIITNTLHVRLPSSTPPEMRCSKPPLKWIDDDHYRTIILRCPQHTTEAEMHGRLEQEATELGVSPLKIKTDVEFIGASLSATTIDSHPTNQGSIISHSTAPTSPSSSVHRPVTSSSQHSDTVPISPVTPSILADIETKRRTGFRNGIRRITGFSRKRKTPTELSPILPNLQSRSRTEVDSLRSPITVDSKSIDFDLTNTRPTHVTVRSPSIRSNKSSSVWSNKVSATTKSSYDNADALIDHDALQRAMESPELVALRDRQLEERQRFLQYQTQLLIHIRTERDNNKDAKRKLHKLVVEEQLRKNDKAADDLESRQLEDELKMVQDHDAEKRSIQARLRHMEAYCQNPSPPPTPIEFNFTPSDGTSSPTSTKRGSIDSAAATMILPERKVTDKDYHNLASCYRERDAMDNLQASKINVLRGKQKRAVENFLLRKEKEIEKLEAQQSKELDEVDGDFGTKEAECQAEFWEKRQALERRWKLQAMIEKAKMERKTGLTYEVLPIQLLSDKEAMTGYGVAR